jgi:hypothetical protein
MDRASGTRWRVEALWTAVNNPLVMGHFWLTLTQKKVMMFLTLLGPNRCGGLLWNLCSASIYIFELLPAAAFHKTTGVKIVR